MPKKETTAAQSSGVKNVRALRPPNGRQVDSTRLGGQAEVREWLKLIPEAVQEAGPFAFIFDAEPPQYVRELMDTLGVEVIVDPPRGRMEVVKLSW
jgi:hypothetical protein